jgi:hypothetical protein
MLLAPLPMHVALPLHLQETSTEVPEALNHVLGLFIASLSLTRIYCNVRPKARRSHHV